jgi:hypothetical protein
MESLLSVGYIAAINLHDIKIQKKWVVKQRAIRLMERYESKGGGGKINYWYSNFCCSILNAAESLIRRLSG